MPYTGVAVLDTVILPEQPGRQGEERRPLLLRVLAGCHRSDLPAAAFLLLPSPPVTWVRLTTNMTCLVPFACHVQLPS